MKYEYHFKTFHAFSQIIWAAFKAKPFLVINEKYSQQKHLPINVYFENQFTNKQSLKLVNNVPYKCNVKPPTFYHNENKKYLFGNKRTNSNFTLNSSSLLGI
jgi:hypothetical protein